MEACEVKYLEIEVKGGEKTSHIRFWHETEGEGDDAHQVERHEKVKAKKKFLEYKQKVMEIADGCLQPGVYEVGFQFLIPQHVPSSIHFADKKSRHEPKAKVKYYVKAKLQDHNEHTEMVNKQVLAIREPAVAYKEGEEQKETSNIKTWCCVDQGNSTMWSTFNKNIFTPHETAVAYVNVDNSECQVACKHVKLFIEQELTIKDKSKHHEHTTTKILVEKEVGGPDAGEKDW